MKFTKAFIFLWVIVFNSPSFSQPISSLKAISPFPIGGAISPELLTNNKLYRKVVTDEFSSITTENVLKYGMVHPEQNSYDFSKGDLLIEFALKNHKRVHGHCLAWHESVPKWLYEFQGDSAAWENLLQQHIQTVVGHYEGRITSWDVVNEAFKDDGSYRMDTINDEKKHRNITLWRNHLGSDYIARAFIYAHKADPKALLFYNEFGQEYSKEKLAAELKMVEDFKQRNIPISGLGIQMHINIDTKEKGITNAIKQLAATGLLIHISELDIAVNTKKDKDFVFTDSLKAVQSKKYAFVVEQYKKLVPKKQQYGITFWNVGDADSWLINWKKVIDYPLLFDTNYQRKECYEAFAKELKGVMKYEL